MICQENQTEIINRLCIQIFKRYKKCNQKTEDLSFLSIASKLNTFKIIFCYSIARILNTAIIITMLQLVDFRTGSFKCRPEKTLCSLNFIIIPYLCYRKVLNPQLDQDTHQCIVLTAVTWGAEGKYLQVQSWKDSLPRAIDSDGWSQWNFCHVVCLEYFSLWNYLTTQALTFTIKPSYFKWHTMTGGKILTLHAKSEESN